MSVPTKLIPHVCMTCGETKSMVPGWGAPYCLNHGPVPGILMMPFPLDVLSRLLRLNENSHIPSPVVKSATLDKE